MSTEKRDALRSRFEAAAESHALGRSSAEYEEEFDQLVDGVIAEALRNAAERLQATRSDPSTYYLEFLGLDRAIKTLEADAAALENNETERTED